MEICDYPWHGAMGKGHRANSIFFFSSGFIGQSFLYSENVLYNKVQNDYYSCQSLLLLSSPMILDTTDLILFQATEHSQRFNKPGKEYRGNIGSIFTFLSLEFMGCRIHKE